MRSASETTILVIEDDPVVRQTLAEILELNGYRVLQAGDGEEGRATALADPPDLIITDINMPGLSGFDLIDQFHHDDVLRSVPVIVISALADRSATRRGMELGADDYITKPFTEDEVIKSIQARLEKKELLDELDAFAHTVAHDLKNPLATLSGRLGLLEMTLATADIKFIRRNTLEAAEAAKRLAVIIDELLVLAGVRRQQVVPEQIDMAAVVREATERVENTLQQNKATVTLPDSWPASWGYAPWVVHVWTNYLSNAAKYGGPTARITVGSEVREGGERVRFWVRDSGAGLDPATQAKLFVPFTRISSVRAKGHGLGLSIVRRIIEKLGGQVGVESALGAGSTFWFELPTRDPAAKEPKKA